MLQQTRHHMMPCPVKTGQADKHKGQDGLEPQRDQGRDEINEQPDPGNAKDTRMIFAP